MTTKLSDRIETLEERLKQLKAKQARLEPRQRTLDESTLRGWLSSALKRPDDKALFGLWVTDYLRKGF